MRGRSELTWVLIHDEQKDAPSPLEDLIDMQCLWILEEEAKSFIRQNNHALALKRYHQIFKVSPERGVISEGERRS